MSNLVSFEIDGKKVSAEPEESIWQVAKRLGTTIPHLCFNDKPGYRSDGNCRACMVEVEGERVLAASCIREAAPGMVARSAGSSRVQAARKGVLELLLADQPERAAGHAFQQAAGGDEVDGAVGAPAAVEGDEEAVEGRVGPRRDQHRPRRRAHRPSHRRRRRAG